MQTLPLNENMFIKMMRMNVAGMKGEELCRSAIFAECVKCKEVFN